MQVAPLRHMVLDTAWPRGIALTLACALALVSRSCASGGAPVVSTTEVQSAAVVGCPFGMPDTRIHVENTPDGADLLFTTTGPQVPALRNRVDEETNLRRPARGRGGPGLGLDSAASGDRNASGGGLRLESMPVRGAVSYERDRGARLHVVATDLAHVPELQGRLRQRAAELEGPGCR